LGLKKLKKTSLAEAKQKEEKNIYYLSFFSFYNSTFNKKQKEIKNKNKLKKKVKI